MGDAHPDRRLAVHIRWMIRHDLPDVLTLEQRCFARPWLLGEFELRLRHPCSSIGMVAEDGDRLIGYMVYALAPRKIELVNFAVHPEFRRRGVGRQMVGKLAGKLCREHRNRVSVDVRETNLGAQLFFGACGFRAIRIVPDLYADSPEDAYRFVLAPALFLKTPTTDGRLPEEVAP